jgi:hypothetical protein
LKQEGGKMEKIIVFDDSPDAVIYKGYKVAKDAPDANPEDFSLGRKQEIPYRYCTYCGKQLKKDSKPWGADFMACKEDYDARIARSDRPKFVPTGVLTPEKEAEFLKLASGPGPVEPYCAYCGEKMKLYLPISAGTHYKFLWVCPNRHCHMVTDSRDGVN